MLEVDWRDRSTMREVRYAITKITTFYSDGVVFEGSMARCPWESGMDIDDSSSTGTNPYPRSLSSESVDPLIVSRWSKDTTSDIVFTNYSNYSSISGSGGATWASESPVSSNSALDHPRIGPLDSVMAPSSAQLGAGLPFTPNNPDKIFGTKVGRIGRRSLKIDTNLTRPRAYDANSSMSSSSSIMQTAIEYDPYSSMFFLNSTSGGDLPTSAVTAVGDNKESMLDDIFLLSPVSA